MRVISTGSAASVVTALVLCLASCATPDAVRQFVTTARDATSKFAPFVNDIADSCVRRKMADRPVTEIADPTEIPTAACKEDSDLAPQVLRNLSGSQVVLKRRSQLPRAAWVCRRGIGAVGNETEAFHVIQERLACVDIGEVGE
jgi:hypothetical protein